MMEADSLDELDYSYSGVDMQLDPEHVSSCLVPPKKFTEADDLVCSDECKLDSPPFNPHLIQAQAAQNASKPNFRGPYRRYTAHQVERLFYLVIEEGMTAKAAALMTGINIRTAQPYIKNITTMWKDARRSMSGKLHLDENQI
jgi:hypothetical protein